MRIRLDLGRVLPGILMLLLGLASLVLLLAVAVIAFFFSFIPSFDAALHVALDLLLLPALLIGAGLVTVLTGFSWRGRRRRRGKGWPSALAERRAREDRMDISNRVGDAVGVAIGLLIVLFLYANQLRGVAFFTPAFGKEAEFFFYGPAVAGMILSLARIVYGRRNAIRPLDSLNALFTAVSAFWLLSLFPFDFTRLYEMFPTAIQFIFGWLTDDIGRLLFLLVGLVSLVNSLYTAILYASVRAHLGHTAGGTAPSLERETGRERWH